MTTATREATRRPGRRPMSTLPPRPSPVAARLRRRRGSAAVEFALVLPMLATVMFGATDLGRFAHTNIAVTNAAQSGAAYGGFHPFDSVTRSVWEAGVVQAITDELSQMNGFDAGKLSVSVNTVTESDGLIRVSVQVAYPFNTLVNWLCIPSSLNLQHTVVTRMIR